MGSINWDIFIKAITLLVLLGNTTATLVLFLRRRNDQRAKAMEDRQEKFDEKLAQQGTKLSVEIGDRKEQHAAIDRRLALAEQAIQKMPSHNDYMKIIDRLSSLERDVGSIDTKTDGMQETLNTIRDHLLERKI
ncbi:MAG TPA: hypothetical protein VGE64_03760 [Xanthomonadaceae bacterium]